MKVIPAILVFLATVSAVHAQVQELEINADRLDIHQDQEMATFSGSVVATQGAMRMTADQMTLFYNNNEANAGNGDAEKNGQQREARRVVAAGNVHFSSEAGTAESDAAEYDPNSRQLVLQGDVRLSRTGNRLHGALLRYDLGTGVSVLEGGNAPISAHFPSQDGRPAVSVEAATLEVHDRQAQARFRGNVRVEQQNRRLTADRLVVHFHDSGDQPVSKTSKTSKTSKPATATASTIRSVDYIEAAGQVHLRTAEEVVKGGYARYDLAAEVIKIQESVILTRGENILKGERLTLDLRSGKSRMEGQSGRVKGLFVAPKKENNKKIDE